LDHTNQYDEDWLTVCPPAPNSFKDDQLPFRRLNTPAVLTSGVLSYSQWISSTSTVYDKTETSPRHRQDGEKRAG